jgi:DNA-binding response OmpR family regulator
MSDKPRILLVDDDVKLVAALSIFLTKRGYQIAAAADGDEGLERFSSLRPDLIVLDIMMPNTDGWEMCKRVREQDDTPVIMLTARGQEYDRVKGLSMGADDYLVKPFSLSELEARVKAVLRRARRAEGNRNGVVYMDETLTVDTGRLLVLRDDTPVSLSPTERRLLFFLVENAGQSMSITRILEAVWGWDYRYEDAYVKPFICRLRQKIEPDPEHPRYVLTERGIGYRFAGETEPSGSLLPICPLAPPPEG